MTPDRFMVLDTATGLPVQLYRARRRGEPGPTHELIPVDAVTEVQAWRVVRRAKTRLGKQYIVAWHPTRAELEARKEKSA